MLKTSLPLRAKRLIEEYGAFSQERKDEILRALRALEKRIGKKRHQELLDLFMHEKMQQFVEELLLHYYDPLYGYEKDESGRYELTADGDDLEAASAEIKSFLINQCRE